MALSKAVKARIQRNKMYRSYYAVLGTRDRAMIDDYVKRTYHSGFGEVFYSTVVVSPSDLPYQS